MSSPRKKETLTKLSFEELEELYERQKNILKNTGLVNKLPDKGKQLKDKFETVKIELRLRRDLKQLEANMETLTIKGPNAGDLREKHVQHVCNMEKLTSKEHYKPFATLVKKDENKTENATQLISLTESITLQAEQANRVPVEQVRKAIEGTEMKQNDAGNSEEDEEFDAEKTCIY